MTIAFTYSTDLVSGSTVTLTLPGFTGSISNQTAVSGVNVANIGSVLWNSSSNALILTVANSTVSANRTCTIVLNFITVFIFPTAGLPLNAAALQISATSVTDNAAASSILSSPAVNTGAFSPTSLSYGKTSITGQSTGAITLGFTYSADLVRVVL